MLRILKFIFTGDWHLCKWETIKEVNVFSKHQTKYGIPTGHGYECRCSHCGRIKCFNIKYE